MRGERSEITRRAFQLKAEKLQHADPLSAMEIKAHVAALSDDLMATDEHYARILKASGSDAARVLRYLTLLAATGQSQKLYDAFHREIDMESLSPGGRAYVAQLLGYTGWVVDAAGVRKQLISQGHACGADAFDDLEYPSPSDEGGEIEGWKATSFPDITPAHVLDSHGVKQETVAQVVGNAISYLRMSGLPVLGVRSVTLPDGDEHAGLLINLLVDGDSAATSEAEWNLYGQLDGADGDPFISGAVSIGLIPKGNLSQHAC